MSNNVSTSYNFSAPGNNKTYKWKAGATGVNEFALQQGGPGAAAATTIMHVQENTVVVFDSDVTFDNAGGATVTNLLNAGSMDTGQLTTDTLTLVTYTFEGKPYSFGTATVGAEAGNIINVAFTFKKASGAVCTTRHPVLMWLSDSNTNLSLTATAADAIAIGSNGTVLPITTGKMWYGINSATGGTFDIDITYAAGAKTWYLVGMNIIHECFQIATITFA